MQLFADHLVVYERENGLPKITIYRLPSVGEPLEKLQGGRTVDFIDPIYSVDPSESQFSSNILRYRYSSMRTPPSVYDYDMDSGISVLKKIETVSKHITICMALNHIALVYTLNLYCISFLLCALYLMCFCVVFFFKLVSSFYTKLYSHFLQ